MTIAKRYELHPSDPETRSWLQIQDLRVGPDDSEPRIEVVAKYDDGSVQEDEEIRLWLTTNEAQELVSVLNVILGQATTADEVNVNGSPG